MSPFNICYKIYKSHIHGLAKHYQTIRIACYVLCCAFYFAFSTSAQKVYKPIKTSLKEKKYSDAIKQFDKLSKDSDYTNDSKLYLLAIQANQGLNDAQNMKLYLKQKYDTIAFFSTTYQIVKNAMKVDSIENEKKDNDKANTKFLRIAYDNIRQYMPNMHAAARFFYKKKKYDEALLYLRLCLFLPHSDLGNKAQLSTKKDTVNAVLYLSSAYNTGAYTEMLKYASLALAEKEARPTIIENLAFAAKAQNDTATYKKWLIEGWNSYPNQSVFFTHLVDFYNEQNQYEKTIAAAHKQLLNDSLHTAAHLALCVAYYEKENYDSCIVNAEHILSTDSLNADAHYYKGASYIGQVRQIVMPERITSPLYKQTLNKRQKLYSLAEPELEIFRNLAPDAVHLWGTLLYQTYYALNRGKKFAEIENLLENYSKNINKGK